MIAQARKDVNSLGDAQFILLHGRMMTVVAMVGELPTEVGGPKNSVEGVADDITQSPGWRERIMSTLTQGWTTCYNVYIYRTRTSWPMTHMPVNVNP
jgi:hypothetical protein